MTMTIDLTPDQEERLCREAMGRGLPTEAVFRELVDRTLAGIGPPPQQTKSRIAGLHEGQTWMADDFDAALPDSFWLGEE